MPPPHNKAPSSFRLDKAETAKLLKAVKKHINIRDLSESLADKREHHRFDPAASEVMVQFEHPGGSIDYGYALIYNICTYGAGLVYRGFLHKGTKLTVFLKTTDGEEYIAKGTVRWCEYYDKQVHIFGVQFNSPVDPKDYTTEEEWVNFALNSDDNTWTQSRRALIAEPDILKFSVIQMMLSNGNISTTNCETLGSTLDHIKSNLYDLILLSDTLDETVPTKEVISQIKAHGYSGPLILSTSGDPTDLVSKYPGINTAIQHPFDLAQLLAVIKDILEQTSSLDQSTEPIYSIISEEYCTTERLDEYIRLVTMITQKLETSIKNDDYQLALKFCNSIYSTGAGYGYPLLSEKAQSVIKELNASCSPLESASSIRQLIYLIKRIQSRPSQDNAA